MTARREYETVIDTSGINREHVEQWCIALKSGQYQQANGSLRDHRGNCCLGVACDIVDSERWIEICGTWYYLKPDVDPNDYDETGYGDDDGGDFVPSANEYPPNDIVEWYGLLLYNPLVYVTCMGQDLVTGDCADGLSCDACHGAACKSGVRSLAELNDKFHWSFLEIAAAISKTYLETS